MLLYASRQLLSWLYSINIDIIVKAIFEFFGEAHNAKHNAQRLFAVALNAFWAAWGLAPGIGPS